MNLNNVRVSLLTIPLFNTGISYFKNEQKNYNNKYYDADYCGKQNTPSPFMYTTWRDLNHFRVFVLKVVLLFRNNHRCNWNVYRFFKSSNLFLLCLTLRGNYLIYDFSFFLRTLWSHFRHSVFVWINVFYSTTIYLIHLLKFLYN